MLLLASWCQNTPHSHGYAAWAALLHDKTLHMWQEPTKPSCKHMLRMAHMAALPDTARPPQARQRLRCFVFHHSHRYWILCAGQHAPALHDTPAGGSSNVAQSSAFLRITTVRRLKSCSASSMRCGPCQAQPSAASRCCLQQ